MELHSFKNITSATLGAIGETFGKVADLYFQDDTWVIRYFVVDTGSWFQSKKVLISPAFIEPFEWNSETLPVNLKPEQIKKAPSWDTDKPISR